MDTNAEQQILEIVQKYGDETPYWQFVENFKSTVGFEAAAHNEEKQAALLSECARQYEYLRAEHPQYFQNLTERKTAELTILTAVVDWAVVKNISMMHFAGFNATAFAASVATKREEQASVTPVEKADMQTPSEPVNVEQSTPVADEPQTRFSLDALAQRAVENYEAKLGQVIRVREYANPAGYFKGTRTAENGDLYDLALVIETEGREIVIDEVDPDGIPYVRGTWSLKFLTGPLAGQTGFAHSPVLNADGLFASDMMMMAGRTIEDMRHSNLSESDLVTLAWLAAQRISGQQVYVGACVGYEEDTDDQVYIQLDPPALVTVDPINIERFRVGSPQSDYQIREYEKDNDILDWEFDFTSDDERLKKFRTLYAHDSAYCQSGQITSTEIVENYEPEASLGVEPTIFTMK